MVRVVSRVRIERPVSTVFGYLAQATKWSEWLDGILDSTTEDARSLSQGGRVHLVIKFLGRRFEMQAKVTEFEEGERIGVRVLSGPFPMAWLHRVDKADRGTLLTTTLEAEPGSFFTVAGPLLKGLLQRHLDDDHATLKALLEAPSMAPDQKQPA